MKNLVCLALVAALVLLTLTLSIGHNNTDVARAQTSHQDSRKKPTYTQAPPTHVVYGLLFRQTNKINQDAATEALNKSIDITYRNIQMAFRRRLNLSEAQAAVLDRVARDFETEVASIDAQADAIIKSAWAKYPPGKPISKENLPKTPKELADLQEKHDDVVLKYREQLRTGFGEKDFAAFEWALFRGFGTEIKTIPATPTRPVGVAKPMPN